MSIIEPPYEADFGDLSTEGAMAYTRGAILQAGAEEGYSLGSVRNALAGYGIDYEEVWLRNAYNGVADIVGNRPAATELSIDTSTGEILSGSPPDNWTGQYVHQVTGQFRAKATTGKYELRTRTFGIKSDVPLTPLDASNAAMQIIEMPVSEDEEDRYGAIGDLLTLNLTGAWYDTRPGTLSSRAT